MADTPIWVQLLTPVITACAGWGVSKLVLLSVGDLKEYEGTWYAYYRDPDSNEVQEENWCFTTLGKVTVSRNGRTTFKGRLKLKGNKAYMNVDSTVSSGEKL